LYLADQGTTNVFSKLVCLPNPNPHPNSQQEHVRTGD